MKQLNNDMPADLAKQLVGRPARLPEDFPATPAEWNRTGTIVGYEKTIGRYHIMLLALDGWPFPVPIGLHRLDLTSVPLH